TSIRARSAHAAWQATQSCSPVRDPRSTTGKARSSWVERVYHGLPSHVEPHPCRLDVLGKTEAAGQRGVGEEGDLVDLAAAQGEHHHAPGLRAQVAAEGRLAVGAGRAYL